LIRKCHVNLLRGMLSYMYVTASCPPLRDGIESTSKSIPGDAAAFAPIACESQGGTRITSIEPGSVCQNMGAASSRAG
jgi:hypothetical protein